MLVVSNIADFLFDEACKWPPGEAKGICPWCYDNVSKKKRKLTWATTVTPLEVAKVAEWDGGYCTAEEMTPLLGMLVSITMSELNGKQPKRSDKDTVICTVVAYEPTRADRGPFWTVGSQFARNETYLLSYEQLRSNFIYKDQNEHSHYGGCLHNVEK